MFYNYRQNNSGGSFVIEPDNGISITVIIEANSEEEANTKAEAIGLYFNGCEDGRDCDCCGDRWSKPWDKGTDLPMWWSEPIRNGKAKQGKDLFLNWAQDKPEGYIHYLDGRVISFVVVNE